ncbi:unnamed protein product [Paramecium sonneborni]|uniref:Transmembrane protein n=1 Tax=Paramecium sonneborni TaxID=65129 RepID=A0A8S1M3C8_9CILI|nr:unnamed protein product [Paramecium sonneborni]
MTYCGNGLVSIEEECDDMNKEDGDGCSKECKIEVNYVCKNYQYSFTQCTYEKYPKFKASLIKQDYQIQYVSLYFDQQVQVMDNIKFSNYIELSLIEVDQEFYNITLNIVQEAQQFCSFVEYTVEIVFYTTLSSPPILEVILNEQLYNQNEAPLINQRDSVRLNLPKYVDDQKQQSALILKNMGTYIMNSMGAASILVLLLGNSFILKGVIEVLQQQSYLRFINVVFPLNLYIYFESSSLVTVQPLLEFFNFNTFTSEIVNMPYIESYEKLKFYEINADLIYNLQSQIFLSLTLLSTYLTCFFLVEIFKALDDSYFFCFGSNIANIFIKIQNSCLSIKTEIENQGLKEFLISNCWDLLFISFLQIRSQSITSTRALVSVVIAYLILYVCAIIISSHFFKENKATSVYKYWLKKFNLFLILKKLLFVAILVLFQRSQQIQSILLTLVCSLYLIYIILIRSQRDILQRINLLMMETSIFIFCLTVALYWKEMENNFDYENQVLLGWFHIAMLLCVLITNLGLQLVAVLVKMKKVIFKKLQNSQIQSDHLRSDPYPLQNVMQFKI